MGAKKSNRPDRRTIRTQHQLKETFIKILGEKSIDKVTVAELTRACDIGRGTFYIHYKDVYDLYDSIVSDNIENLTAIFNQYYPHDQDNNFAPLAEHFVHYIVENKPVFEVMTNHGSDIKVLNQICDLLIRHIINIEHDDPANMKQMAIIQFAAYGMIGVIVDWLVNKPNARMEDLIQVITTSVGTLRSMCLSAKD
ncbi:TetR/AcrR family transcriptional regulator [Secundilactobacillus folii]|uniref:TetR family transcriptional regulator n=1 Tax=Secundilactobacillus folii TaxID=2678357 RepID=A0A7X2XVM5_9LACO|nr:TetR/AcrR family transcriptional regulator [Secundilactobacillus folii]MTV81748.1 TetR family transcriptional regulator [Secundilactobacillus folii]